MTNVLKKKKLCAIIADYPPNTTDYLTKKPNIVHEKHPLKLLVKGVQDML